MNPLIAILIAVVLVLLNGIFVAAEFALIAARRTRVERQAEEGDRGARRVLNAMQNLGSCSTPTQEAMEQSLVEMHDLMVSQNDK